MLCFLAYAVGETTPVPDRFYQKYLPTQTPAFKKQTDYHETTYTKLIVQIRNDTLITPHQNQSFTQKVEIGNGSVKVERAKASLFLIYLKHSVKKLFNTIDIYLGWGYCYVFSGINGLIPEAVTRRVQFPIHLNYFFILTFFFLNFLSTWIVQLILSREYSRFTTRKIILRKLRQLNESIEATVRSELSSGFSVNETKIGLNLNHRKATEHPLAGIRQIEKSLIDIFDDFHNLPLSTLCPEFIIVFDELDKIDPHTNTNIDDKEEELTDFNHSASGFTGGAATRLRKQNVLRLLANMKYFITTVKAKFVFIAGRELYDAFLADVSDREFSISSIFHEVIYVESFLSDSSDNNRTDITSMTEHYICQFLMPKWYIFYQTCLNIQNRYDALTLKVYQKYLNDETRASAPETEKAVMQLYQFIHYLTHVSNGAPKKLPTCSNGTSFPAEVA